MSGESIPIPKLESESEREERLSIERNAFRKDLDELMALDVLSGKREELKQSMEKKYASTFPGLIDYIVQGSPIYKENGEIKDPLQKVYGLINPPKNRPLDMNWYPPRLEKNR